MWRIYSNKITETFGKLRTSNFRTIICTGNGVRVNEMEGQMSRGGKRKQIGRDRKEVVAKRQ